MQGDLLRLAADLAERGEPFVLATVIDRGAPSSARAGDACLVTADGAFHGFVGGSCTRPTVVEQARRALREGRSRVIVLAPDPADGRRPGADVFPMTCHSGGSVEIYLQPVLPAPRLLVYGLTPAARAAARLGAALGWEVWGIDPAADRAAFPEARSVFTEAAAAAPAGSAREVFAVVATQGEWDEEAVLAALAHAPSYVGVVSSVKRAEELKAFLDKKVAGESRALLEGLRAPAGLRIGAQGGEEIALSILAEIVERRRAAPRPKRVALPMAAPAEPATDPVCGMTVAVATARHRAEHQGRTWYFCCAGCREKFVQDAERYLPAGERKA